jgi:hypothetical protein
MRRRADTKAAGKEASKPGRDAVIAGTGRDDIGASRGASPSVRQWEYYEYADQIDTNPRQWEPGEF